MRVTKRVHFDAAHRLPNYNGPCANLHGHRWELEVTIQGDIHENGMVIDFNELSRILDREILTPLDHHFLNDIVGNPTAENLLLWIARRLNNNIIYWHSIKLWEAPDSCAELSKDDLNEAIPF